MSRSCSQRGSTTQWCGVVWCGVVCGEWSTTPHHTTPHHTTPHHTTPQHTTPHHTTPHHTAPHHTTPRHATPHHTTPHHHDLRYFVVYVHKSVFACNFILWCISGWNWLLYTPGVLPSTGSTHMYRNLKKTQLFALKSQPGRRSKYVRQNGREQTFASIKERRQSACFLRGGQRRQSSLPSHSRAS